MTSTVRELVPQSRARSAVSPGFRISRRAAGAWGLKAPAEMLRNGSHSVNRWAGPSRQPMTGGSTATAA